MAQQILSFLVGAVLASSWWAAGMFGGFLYTSASILSIAFIFLLVYFFTIHW